MRRLATYLLVFIVLGFAGQHEVLSQTPENKKDDLLRSYLDSGSERDRKALLALEADKLQSSIKELAFVEASKTETIKAEIECPDGHTRPYWFYIPKTYDPAESYPLFVLLHGGVMGAPASAAQGMMKGMVGLLDEEWAEKLIVLSPAAIAQTTSQDGIWLKEGGMINVLHTIRHLKSIYNIDDDKIFIGGKSDGGSGAYAFAYRHPDAFAGYFPWVGHPRVAAVVGTSLWYKNLKGKRIYHIIGGQDRVQPARTIKPIIEAINKAGADIEYKVFDDARHDLSYLNTEMINILNDRVAKWNRDLLPQEVDWTTDDPKSGRHAWISIDSIEKLGKFGADCAPGVRFPANARTQDGRVLATYKSGKVEVKAHGVGKLSVWVAPKMLDKDGKLLIEVNGCEAYQGTPEADAELILSEFERTLDRKLPFIARIEIDVLALSPQGRESKPPKKDKSDDERESEEF